MCSKHIKDGVICFVLPSRSIHIVAKDIEQRISYYTVIVSSKSFQKKVKVTNEKPLHQKQRTSGASQQW